MVENKPSEVELLRAELDLAYERMNLLASELEWANQRIGDLQDEIFDLENPNRPDW